MKREDFETNIDWVIYKVTGKKPVTKQSTKPVLMKHTLPKDERKHELKFYHNKVHDRYGVFYKNKHLCACSENEIIEIQDYFDKNYNGRNIEPIKEELKNKYNMVKKNPTHKDANIVFNKRGNGRLTAMIHVKGKTHSICSCNYEQADEVSDMYNSLKKNHDLEYIKEKMKAKYNYPQYKSKKTQQKHVISIDDNGMCYKDGKMIGVDSKLYKVVENYIGEL